MQFCLGAMYAPATHAVMSLEAWQAAQISDDLRAVLASQINNKGTLQREDFANYWGIPNVIVDEQRYAPIGTNAQARLYRRDHRARARLAQPEMRTFLRNFMLRGGAASLHDPRLVRRGPRPQGLGPREGVLLQQPLRRG